MNSLTRTMTTAAAMTAVLAIGAHALAQTDDAAGYGDGYASGGYGRIRSAEGGAAIIRADGESGETDRAAVNAPLFPGDAIRTDGGQRVEVQLAGGTIVRIDRGGEVVFQSLPKPSAKYVDNTVLVLNAGTVSITSRLSDKDEFRIDTRGVSVYLLGEGEFRIETDDRGVTQVASRRGVAEVVGNDASVLVRGGMRTAVAAGSIPETPRAYSAFAQDGFDRWCDARDDVYRVHDRNTSGDDEPIGLPAEVQPYQAELSTHGSWAVDSVYGSVWYPSAVPVGWRPYSDGYWSYGPGGFFWVSYEPWGWAPYHYGNWQWTLNRGWCWVPGRVFGGAWVSWSWGSAYVGWAPLDYWGRPGWGGGAYYAGYYDPGCWTFVGYGHLNAHNVGRYAVPMDRVGDDIRHARVVARGPSVDPRRIAESPAWRERALRQVADDQASHLRPVAAVGHPERRLIDVQEQLMRRPGRATPSARSSRETSAAPSTDRRTVVPRSRRIVVDPRAGAAPTLRPDTKEDIRELYQRMSRPRETRSQDATAPRANTPPNRSHSSRADSLRSGAPRQEAPAAQSPQAVAPRAQRRGDQAPPAETPGAQVPRAAAPQAQAPRAQTPRASAPRAQAPRAPTPRPQAPRPQAKPKQSDKH